MYFGGTGIVPTCFFLSVLRVQLGQVFGMVLGELRPGVDRVFLPLECPGLLPLLALAQARGLVAEDRQERDALGLDQLGHEARDVEGGVVAVEFADLEERAVLPRDVGEPADGDERDGEPGRGLAARRSSGRRSRSRILGLKQAR